VLHHKIFFAYFNHGFFLFQEKIKKFFKKSKKILTSIYKERREKLYSSKKERGKIFSCYGGG